MGVEEWATVLALVGSMAGLILSWYQARHQAHSETIEDMVKVREENERLWVLVSKANRKNLSLGYEKVALVEKMRQYEEKIAALEKVETDGEGGSRDGGCSA